MPPLAAPGGFLNDTPPCRGGLTGGPGGMKMPGTPLGDCCGPAHLAAAPAQPDPDAVPMLLLHLCLAVLTGLILLAGAWAWPGAHLSTPVIVAAWLRRGQ